MDVLSRNPFRSYILARPTTYSLSVDAPMSLRILTVLLLALAFATPPVSCFDRISQFEGHNSSSQVVGLPAELQRGMTFAAFWKDHYGKPEAKTSLTRLAESGATWVAILIAWYQVAGDEDDIFRDPDRTPTDESLQIAINEARDLGFRVTLKLNIRNQDGTLRKKINPADWNVWFASYRAFLSHYADIAERLDVDQLIVGTELDSSVLFEGQWRDAIKEVRSRYSGPIVYGASRITCLDNITPRCQPGYRLVGWWDALDFVGIEGWFPLSGKTDPTVEELIHGWSGYILDIESWIPTTGKQVILTEVGYPSYDGGTMSPSTKWQGEPIDLQEQADAYQATLQAFSGRQWLVGYYWWYWDWRPDAGGKSDGSWLLQNKPAEQILSAWYRAPPNEIPPVTTTSTTTDVSLTTTDVSEAREALWIALPVLALLLLVLRRRSGKSTKASRRGST